MSGYRLVGIPINPSQKLGDDKESDLVDMYRDQRLVGRLIYLSHTRPDLAFVMSMVSKLMYLPYKKHFEAIYQILRYLKSILDKGLLF